MTAGRGESYYVKESAGGGDKVQDVNSNEVRGGAGAGAGRSRAGRGRGRTPRSRYTPASAPAWASWR